MTSPVPDDQNAAAAQPHGRMSEDADDYQTVQAGSHEVDLYYEEVDPARTAELEPHVRGLLADFDDLCRVAIDFLWSRHADGTETDAERAHHEAALSPHTLVVLPSGEFHLHLGEEEGQEHYYLDGYWPAVSFQADRTPVDVEIHA